MKIESIRITIMMKKDVVNKVRQIQAKEISETGETVYFSGVIDKILRKALKLN